MCIYVYICADIDLYISIYLYMYAYIYAYMCIYENNIYKLINIDIAIYK